MKRSKLLAKALLPDGGEVELHAGPLESVNRNACRLCAHFRRETESWEMPHIWWYECGKRPAMANLKSFPFHATTCTSFEKRTTRIDDLSAALSE